jgi:hypothetical protein
MSARISIPFKETGIDVITFGGRTRLSRVQSVDISANMPATPVQELGSNRLVGRIFDVPEITVSISSMDVGARTAFTMANVPWASAAMNTGIELQNISYVCLAQTYKEQAGNDIARTLYIPGAKLDSLSMNYSVNGDATEDFSFQASKYVLLRYDVAIASGQIGAGGVFTFSPNARVLKNGLHVLSVFTNQGYQPLDVIQSTTPTSVTFDTNRLPVGTDVLITYHADLTNQWQYTHEYPNVPPGYTPAPDQPVGMRGWGIEIFLVRTGGARRVLRAQTCTIQAQMNTQRIQELGNEDVVGYVDNIPEITGTLEVMSNDMRLYRWLAGDNAETEDNFNPSELGRGDWGMLIRMWRRHANRQTDTPEKTIWVPMLDITQATDRAQVGQDTMLTFNWASRDNRLFIYKGNHPDFTTL